MSVYPKWMEKRHKTIIEIEIPIPGPPGSGGGTGGGGGGGGGFTMAYRDKPIPKVTIKKVVVLDDYESINITVLKVIDLSLNGGI